VLGCKCHSGVRSRRCQVSIRRARRRRDHALTFPSR
jgi:hypothetical protein